MADRKVIVNGDLATEEKFADKMRELKDRGAISTHRSGDTGIGKTLEDELGVEENSVQASDIEGVELKANRKGTSSKITLMTKSPEKRSVNNKILRENYGIQTEESLKLNPNAKILHTTVNAKGFNTLNGEPFMKLTSQGSRIHLEHAQDGILEDVYWEIDSLVKAQENKFPEEKLYHVQAETGVDENGNETFHYTEASALEGFSSDKLMKCIEDGDIEMDIRLGLHASGKQKGKNHDNGTAFRVTKSKLGKCFKEKRDLI